MKSSPSSDLRVVSLLPSATEIVCLVGGQPNLVGISHECDYPAAVQKQPVLTSSKVDLSPSSLKIDQDVRKLLKHALAVYDIDTDGLKKAQPDFIVTQDLCDVCAVSLDDVKAACALVLPDAQIINLHPTCWDDVMRDIQHVATAFGIPERGLAEVADIEAQRAAIAKRSAAQSTRPNVLTIEWLDPVMIGATWMPEIVHAAGGFALVTKSGDHAPTLSRDDLEKLDPAPDVVLFKPCGFELERTFSERKLLESICAGLDWPAVHNGNLYVADGNAFFNRPGPRLLESIEILAACIHPEEFQDFAKKHSSSYVRL